jgi:NADP-dependent 3-hydroxy acid dehydrogenase YdfG
VRCASRDTNRAENKGFTPLQAEDIADIIHFVVSRPYHVNIADLIVITAQASSTIVKGINKKTAQIELFFLTKDY